MQMIGGVLVLAAALLLWLLGSAIGAICRAVYWVWRGGRCA
ncbi:hypothetical protein [Arenimonas sp.]|nr:hypothetical protein [Arenimonas sp.]